MENFSKFSVSNNHLKAFKAGIVEILEYVSNLENEFTQKLESIKRLSEQKKNLLDSLEAKFNKYSFKYQKPLADNSIEVIKSYVSYLESELVISVVSLDNEKREKVIKDNLDMTSEIAQIERLSNYIDINGREIIDLENKLHDIRIPEKDANEEVIIDFKTLKAKRKEEKKNKPVETEQIKVVQLDELPGEEPEISPSIFKTTESDESLSEGDIVNFFDSKFVSEEPEVIKEDEIEEEVKDEAVDVTITAGSSLADKVETVYGDSEYWPYIYNYSDANQGTIDRKASEAEMEVEEAVYDDDALTGIVVAFPTEIVTYEASEEDAIEDEYLAPIYDEDEHKSRAA